MDRRIIDIHNHPNWHGMTVDRLIANMDEHGIEKTCLLSWEASEEERQIASYYDAINDPRHVGIPLCLILEGLEKYPDRLIPAWAPDPRQRSSRARLRAAVSMHGIKLYGELKCRMRYDNPDAVAMFRHCAALELPVLFHLSGMSDGFDELPTDMHATTEWYGGDITVVDTMCRLCPDTMFIGHGRGFWEACRAETAAAPPNLTTLMKKHRNLYADLSAGSGLSAMTRDLAHARKFLVEFQDRVLFGRDDFNGNLLGQLDRMDLPGKVMNNILCGNTESLLQIG